jgi:hypothetical protein
MQVSDVAGADLFTRGVSGWCQMPVCLQTPNKQYAKRSKPTRLRAVLFVGLGLALAAVCTGRANTLVWTNVNSGIWGAATNWSPNGVPGGGDTAIITNGPVTVTVDPSSTFGGLVLGGAGTCTVNWTAGDFNGPVTINSGGLLVVDCSSAAGAYGMITNGGTIRLVSGFGIIGPTGGIVNLPGGLMDFTTNNEIGVSISATVVNQGLVRKSGGSGTSYFDPRFEDYGTVEVQTGTLEFRSSGGTLHDGAVFTGAGVAALGSGTFKLVGNVNSRSNLVLAGASLAGTSGSLSGLWTWRSGEFAGGCTLTVAANGLLVVPEDSVGVGTYGMITNAGTVRISGGFGIIGNAGGGMVNLPGGLMDFTSNVGVGRLGSATVVNRGSVRKSGGSGTSYFDPWFEDYGTVEVQTGTLEFRSSGGTLYDGTVFTGAGVAALASGTFTLVGNVNSHSNLVLAGASLAGTSGSMSGLWTWSGGDFASGCALTVAAEGLLVAGGGGMARGMITNAGTVRVVNGDLVFYGDSGGGMVNLPGGLLDLASDYSVRWSGYSLAAVVNRGLVRKSGGAGTTGIDTYLYNTGTLDAQTGTIGLNGGYNLAGGTLNFGLNSLGSFGRINLSGAATLTGTVSANFNGGYFPVTGNSFPVLTYGSRTGIFTQTNLPPWIMWQTNYGPTSFTLTVLKVLPELRPLTNQVVNELAPLTVTVGVVHYDPGQVLGFRLAAAPSGMAINAGSGVITWTPGEADGPSTNTVTVSVLDPDIPWLGDTNSFTVVVKELNVAPVLTVPANTTINELTTLTVAASATDPDIPTNRLTFSLVSPPTGMTINPTNGTITWTPTEAQGPGSYPINVMVTDLNTNAVNQQSLSDAHSFTVTVNELPLPFANTQPVTASGTGLMLNGMATANGLPTTAWFEWGAGKSYANQTALSDVGSGSNLVVITGAVTGLVPGQSYHGRLVVSNASAVVRGTESLFGVGKQIHAWGDHSHGKADQPAGNWVAVAAGEQHTLGLLDNGSVVGWGDDYYGQASPPAGLNQVKAIAAGTWHSLALKRDKTVVAWGYNEYGQTNVPAGLSNVVSIAAGGRLSMALREDGSVVVWGYNRDGQTNVPAGLSNVVSIAAGATNCLALRDDGTVVAWGGSGNGETNVPAGLTNVVAIDAQIFSCLAVKCDGTVTNWGALAAPPAELTNVVTVGDGGYYAAALKSDGGVVAWGANDYGQSLVPAGLTNVVQVAVGTMHCVALGELVPPEPPRLSVPSSLAGRVTLTLTGGEGYRFAIRASTNLAQWVPLRTNTSPFTLEQTNAGPVRFYRAIWIP